MSAPSGASVVLLTEWDQLRRRVERLRDSVLEENADGYSYSEERNDVAALCDAVLALIDLCPTSGDSGGVRGVRDGE